MSNSHIHFFTRTSERSIYHCLSCAALSADGVNALDRDPRDVASDPEGKLIVREPLHAANQPWTGEGLPPVGTVCEIRAHRLNDWSKAEIKFAYRNVVVWDWVGEPSISGLCTAYAHAIEIRPIRTPEQIAADERDRAVREVYDSCNGQGRSVLEMLGEAYDAGRKQVAP